MSNEIRKSVKEVDEMERERRRTYAKHMRANCSVQLLNQTQEKLKVTTLQSPNFFYALPYNFLLNLSLKSEIQECSESQDHNFLT